MLNKKRSVEICLKIGCCSVSIEKYCWEKSCFSLETLFSLTPPNPVSISTDNPIAHNFLITPSYNQTLFLYLFRRQTLKKQEPAELYSNYLS